MLPYYNRKTIRTFYILQLIAVDPIVFLCFLVLFVTHLSTEMRMHIPVYITVFLIGKMFEKYSTGIIYVKNIIYNRI